MNLGVGGSDNDHGEGNKQIRAMMGYGRDGVNRIEASLGLSKGGQQHDSDGANGNGLNPLRIPSIGKMGNQSQGGTSPRGQQGLGSIVVKFESMELGVEIIAKVMVGLDQRKVLGMDNSNRTRRSRAMDKDKEPSRVTCKDIPLVEPVTASSIAVVLVLGIALCKDIVVAMRVIIKCYHNLLVLQPQEGNSNHTRRNSNSICNNSNNNNSNSTPTSTTTSSSSSSSNNNNSSSSNSISNSSNSICNSSPHAPSATAECCAARKLWEEHQYASTTSIKESQGP